MHPSQFEKGADHPMAVIHRLVLIAPSGAFYSHNCWGLSTVLLVSFYLEMDKSFHCQILLH